MAAQDSLATACGNAFANGRQASAALPNGKAHAQPMREHLRPVLNAARETARGLGQSVRSLASDQAQAMNTYVRANPWYFIGGAVVFGLAVGVLVMRRR